MYVTGTDKRRCAQCLLQANAGAAVKYSYLVRASARHAGEANHENSRKLRGSACGGLFRVACRPSKNTTAAVHIDAAVQSVLVHDVQQKQQRRQHHHIPAATELQARNCSCGSQ